MVVERRRRSAPEAGGSRKRIFWARATPKRGQVGDVRARGVAHDPGASRRST